jgi:tetratricopeptide (TPR) repeat protein
MSPKTKKQSRLFADHKAAWITGILGVLAALVGSSIGLFKFAGSAASINSATGTDNNHSVAITANQEGNHTVANNSTVAPQTISVGQNQAPFYAPQSTVINNYYSPISNSVTRDAFEALESKLASATNKIELTVNEVQKLAQALRDLDHRTAAMEILPDGRTKFGATVAGNPTVILETIDSGFQSYADGDFRTALANFQKAIFLFESAPSNLLVESGSITPEGKEQCYVMAALTAQQLHSNSIANEFAERAVKFNPGIRSQTLLSTTLANLGIEKNMEHDSQSAFEYFSRAIAAYETAQGIPNLVGYYNVKAPDGAVKTQAFNQSDVLQNVDASRLYGMAALTAYSIGSNAVALQYAGKAYQINHGNTGALYLLQTIKTNR